jgi:hypothetical protein
MVIGIRSGGTIGGTKVIGHDRHTPARTGLGLIMMDSSFMRVIGKETAAVLNTIIGGIEIRTATTTAIEMTTITTIIMMTMTTIIGKELKIFTAGVPESGTLSPL